MMGPFLMLIGIGLLYVAIAKGKSDPFLAALGIHIPNIGEETQNWFVAHILNPIKGPKGQDFLKQVLFDPLTAAIKAAIPKFPGT